MYSCAAAAVAIHAAVTSEAAVTADLSSLTTDNGAAVGACQSCLVTDDAAAVIDAVTRAGSSGLKASPICIFLQA